jgi:hypothetical protein
MYVINCLLIAHATVRNSSPRRFADLANALTPVADERARFGVSYDAGVKKLIVIVLAATGAAILYKLLNTEYPRPAAR